jgi:ABC-type multidrug transport system fused ATPase/permease subunit
VDQVIEICQLDKFIGSQPNGFATRIGAEGVTLSAGQKQRLAIAQALLRDTPILLLDEATANIDFETERKLLQALFVDIRDKLVVFVTHRNSAALLADRVFECREHNIVDITRQFRGDGRKDLGEFESKVAPKCRSSVWTERVGPQDRSL